MVLLFLFSIVIISLYLNHSQSSSMPHPLYTALILSLRAQHHLHLFLDPNVAGAQ